MAASSPTFLLHNTNSSSFYFRLKLSQIQPFILSRSPSFCVATRSGFRRVHNRSGNGRGEKREARVVVSVTNNNVAAAPKGMDERVQQVHSISEFDELLVAAKNKLVVVEYAASHSVRNKKIYPFMVSLSKTCADVDFLLVMGDESEELRALCHREKVEHVSYFLRDFSVYLSVFSVAKD